MQWRDVNGYDWCLIDTPETGPYLNLTLGYGLVHEPLHEFGTLQLLAGMLESELARPIEIAAGNVSVPEVSVTVDADTTAIVLRGHAAALRATWQRLAEIFAGRQPLAAAQPAMVNFSAAPRDLSSRFGVSSLTLATTPRLKVQAAHDPTALLRYLDPSAGNLRAVMSTNTEELVTTTFAPPGRVGAMPSHYRNDARHGAMQFPPGYALISTVVPRSADGSAAIRVLTQQAAQHVHDVTQRDLGVTVSVLGIGPDMLATVMTTDAILGSQQRSQVHALLASRPIPDHRIAASVDWEHNNSNHKAALARRVHGVNDAPVTEHGTKQALAQAHTTLRCFTEPHSKSPAGYDRFQPELASPEGKHFRTRYTRDSLTVGDDVLEYRRADTSVNTPAYSRVDLRNLALVIADPRGGIVLIDDEYRLVEIRLAAYRHAQRLRELLDQLAEGTPRITAYNAVLPAASRPPVDGPRPGGGTTLKVLSVLAVVAMEVVLASLLSNFDASQNANDADAEPDEVETTVGETATLSNRSDVTVHSIQEYSPEADAQFPTDSGHHFLAAIEYCAAEPEQLDPQHFRMFVGEQRILTHTVEAVEDRLAAQQLQPGECATGNLGFYTEQDQITQVQVQYTTNDHRLTWNESE